MIAIMASKRELLRYLSYIYVYKIQLHKKNRRSEPNLQQVPPGGV